MRGCRGLTQQIAPNLKCIIREATHAAKRATSKPEQADPFLEEIHDKLVSSTHNISKGPAQLHHAVGGGNFAAQIRELEDHIGVEVKSMRAANHKHESFAKPTGRCVLYPAAYLTVAEAMVASDSAAQSQATDILKCPVNRGPAQATMLGDAATECLVFARLLDDAETDNAKLNDELAEYLDRLRVSLPGYTPLMLKNLKRSRVMRMAANDIIALGCPQGVPESIINKRLARKQNFTEVAKEVLEAEFPNYDLNKAC